MAAAATPDTTAPALFAEGVSRHLAGDLGAARHAYREALQRDPDLAEACNNLAVLLAAAGDAPEAEALLARAVRLRPDYGEAHNNLGLVRSADGRHAEAVADFGRAVGIDGARAPWLNNLGNACVEAFRFAEALAAYDRALAIDPDDPECWSNRGLALRGLRRPDDAVASFERALSLAPSHVNALSNLAVLLKEQKRTDEAIALMARAVGIEPANAALWCNFAAIHEARGEHERMRELALRAAELDPAYPESYNLLANGEMEAGRYDAALARYQQALALDPGNRNANWNLALIWLLRGDFERGWPQFEWRKRLHSVLFDHGQYEGEEWRGEPLAGRDVLLHSEQGIGDAIQFVRYAALLEAHGAGRVYLECPYPIVPLLHGVRGVHRVIARGTPLPPYQVHANLMSLPGLLGTTLDTIPSDVPYLPVEPRPARALVRVPRGTLAVGIVWAGNPVHARDFLRSAPLAAFEPLVRIPGVRCFSLQKGEVAERSLVEQPIAGLENLAPHLHDFRDTAAVIDALDLVITVDTSVAHLAGALGAETWLLLPHVPDFRWMLDRDDSPWYPTMRLFRQPAPRDWDSVFRAVADALRERASRPATRRETSATRDDESIVSLASATRHPDGRARFDLWIPLAALAPAARFAEYEAELVGGGHDLPMRRFLDEALEPGDVVVDCDPGLGLCALTAVTGPTVPAALVLADPDPDNASRVAAVIARRAPAVGVSSHQTAHAALSHAASLGPDRVVLRAGATANADAVADAVGQLAPAVRPALVLWSRLVPAEASAALGFLESLGYLTTTLSIIDGDVSLDALGRQDQAQAVLSLLPAALERLESRAATASVPAGPSGATRAPVSVSIAIGPAVVHDEPTADGKADAAGRPARVAPVRDAVVGIDWQLRADTGWGVYGTNLALELERSGRARPAVYAAVADDLPPLIRFGLDRVLRDAAVRAAPLRQPAARTSCEGVMLRALGNNLAPGELWARVSAGRNVGVVFFEDTAFDAEALQRARSLDLIVTGSRWNEEVLRAQGLSRVTTVLQGTDPTVFHPGERRGMLGDRFVVFSGGKLEYRKGQDLVIAAFRRFHARHPEAFLLTAWHNNWPQLIADLDLAGHVRGAPRSVGGVLALDEWLAANGVPAGAHLDVGRVPNALMGQVVREAHVALFPNRCEGGTNLVAMECMAAGVPTIVADNTGQQDLVATGGAMVLRAQRAVARPTRFYREVQGWGESDVEEMVSALETMYTDRSTARAVAERGAAAMSRLTWPSQVATLLASIAPLL